MLIVRQTGPGVDYKKKLIGEPNNRESFREEIPLVASVSALITSDTLRGPDLTQVMTPRCLPAIFPCSRETPGSHDLNVSK